MPSRIVSLMPKFTAGEIIAMPAGLRVSTDKTFNIHTRSIVAVAAGIPLWVFRTQSDASVSLDGRHFVVTAAQPYLSKSFPGNRYLYDAQEVVRDCDAWQLSLMRRQLWIVEKLVENATVVGTMPVMPAPGAVPTLERIRAVAPRL